MKKNKLFTALAAVALLTGTGVEVINNAPVAQAATKKTTKKAKKAKKSKKTAKYATINIKSGAPVYKITFNSNGSKVKKITRLTKKGKKLSLRGGSSPAIWSTKYKKTTYYYIGGKYAVRAKDAKRTSKKKVPTLNSLIKKAQAEQKAKIDAANNTLKAKAADWQAQIDNVKPKTYTGKVNSGVQYWKVDTSTGKIESTTPSKMTDNTTLSIIYKTSEILSNGNMAYIARTSDDQIVIVAASDVTLDDPNAQVPDQQAYNDAVKKANDINDQAKKDIEQTKKDLENQLSK